MSETVIDIKALRDSLGLTQEAAARLVGVSFVTWCRWEKGHHRPHRHLAKLILRLPELLEESNRPAGAGNGASTP